MSSVCQAGTSSSSTHRRSATFQLLLILERQDNVGLAGASARARFVSTCLSTVEATVVRAVPLNMPKQKARVAHIVAVFGVRVSEGVETLLCSVEGTRLDSILREGGDASLHLRNLRDSESDLLGSEGVWCGRCNAKLGSKELGGVVIDGAVWDT